MCDQQRLRPACAYAQTDQSICLSLEYSTSVKQLTEHHLEFLSSKVGCTGSSKSTLVKMLHCWKSHTVDQILKTQTKTLIHLHLFLIFLLFYFSFLFDTFAVSFLTIFPAFQIYNLINTKFYEQHRLKI